ncbi:hypothetical protein ACVWY5_002323 [Bradyrhizobium sp. USDA 3256]
MDRQNRERDLHNAICLKTEQPGITVHLMVKSRPDGKFRCQHWTAILRYSKASLFGADGSVLLIDDDGVCTCLRQGLCDDC